MRQMTVYREPGRFAGWPANYGLWAWGNGLVLCFTVGYHDSQGRFHARDTARPFETLQARSLDGGETWQVQPFPGRTPGGCALSADEHMRPELGVAAAIAAGDAPSLSPGGFDLLHPDLAILCARTGLGAGVESFFYVSTDRCHTWQGPNALPLFGQTGIAARTDVVILGASEALLFLTANKSDGHEGRVLCAHSGDGLGTFDLRAFVGKEPPSGAFEIMPASVRLAEGRILTAIRCRGADGAAWIDLWRSEDEGRSWRRVARPVQFAERGHSGNPPTLTLLADGRLVLTYGNRDAPYTIAARLSINEGCTWSGEITLRAGGGCRDLGYPRTVARADGALVTAYYFNDRPDGDGERFIGATIWRP
jgi:hypothetical protein